jgi:carbonic anhydrase
MITQSQSSQANITPDQALDMLIEGNQRFVQRKMTERDFSEQIKSTSTGQWPFAAVLACIDSRVSSELVFDQGIGDIFSARVAGNVVNTDILGSLEFACAAAGSKLVVVQGHSSCGAVKGACDGVELGNLTSMLAKIKPAIEAIESPADAAQRNSKNTEFVDAVTRKNVQMSVEGLRQGSEVLRDLEEQGKIKIIGAMYDVSTGVVEFDPR